MCKVYLKCASEVFLNQLQVSIKTEFVMSSAKTIKGVVLCVNAAKAQSCAFGFDHLLCFLLQRLIFKSIGHKVFRNIRILSCS